MNKKPKTEGESRGSIICTASNAGLYPLPIAPLYAASKFGVVGLVRSTARVVEKAHIQINALAPAVLGMLTLAPPGRKSRFQESRKGMTDLDIPYRHQHRPRQGSLPAHDGHPHGDASPCRRPVAR